MNIGPNFGGSSLMDMVGLDSNVRIANLQRQIINLQKQMLALQKKMMHETDATVLVTLSNELNQLSKQVSMLQTQIEMLEASEQRKHTTQHTVVAAASETADHKPA